MNNIRFISGIILMGLLATGIAGLAGVIAQSSPQHQMQNKEPMKDCSMIQHDRHDAAVSERGDKVMGFSHVKTTHHFLLTRVGGVIEVKTNDPEDTSSRDQIREHLSHIAGMFKEGKFEAPMLIHDQTPPGTLVMRRLKDQIDYSFEKTERGGRVRITSNDPAAVNAIYEFLRFQIAEHHTGDSLEVTQGPL
jgi:TusA-related sulfurtransferase